MKINNSKFCAEIATGNAAFQDGNRKVELVRIENVIMRDILSGMTAGVCMDICGQKVGEWSAKPGSATVKAVRKEIDKRASALASRAIAGLPVNIMALGKLCDAARLSLLDGNCESDVISQVRSYAEALNLQDAAARVSMSSLRR